MNKGEKTCLTLAPLVRNADHYFLAFVFSCNLAGILFWCSYPREKCGPSFFVEKGL
jgi:hypothetical protein